MRAKGSLASRSVRNTLSAGVAVIVAAALMPAATAADWLTFRGGPQRLNYTPEAFAPPFTLMWKFTTEATGKRVPPVVTADRVYVAAGRSMYALNPASGAQLWTYDAGATILGAPAYAGGRVFFGANNGEIIALNAADGSELWVVQTPRAVRAALAVVEGVVYAASLDRRILALDAATGEERWATRLTDEVWGAIAVADGRVWAPTADGQLFGIDARNGRARVQVVLPRRRALMHAAVVSHDAVYVAGRRSVVALTLRGVQRWAVDLEGFIAAAPAYANERLYVPLTDGRVVALDALRGTQLWLHDFDNPLSTAPTVVNDVVLTGAVGGVVYALDAATGAPRWWHAARPGGLAGGVQAGFDLAASPVYADGSLYLIWDDGSLARLDAKWLDAAGPVIDMLTPSPQWVTGVNLPRIIGARIYDPDSGLDGASLEMILDETPLEASWDPYTGYFTYSITDDSPISLERGWHTVAVSARDQRGNLATKRWRFLATVGGEAMQPPTPPPPAAPAQPAAPGMPGLPTYPGAPAYPGAPTPGVPIPPTYPGTPGYPGGVPVPP